MFKTLRKFRTYSQNRKYFDFLSEYLENKINLPSLHIVKQNNINHYRLEFDIKILVETGTFMGDMVEAQKANFKKVFSIELSEDLFQRASNRFLNDENVKILQGDSGLVLKNIISEITEPAIFWLDGHYSAGVTAKSDKNTPILAELSTILNHMDSHVVLIDDARLFNGEDDYPTIPELCTYVLSIKDNKKIVIADDIIRITAG